MTYDERNRLSQVTVAFTGGASYDYNGMGQRVFKDSGMVGNTADTVFVYGQNGQLLGEYPDGGNPSTEYIWLNSRPVGLIRNGTLYYIQSDHLGTPRRVIEPGTGTIRWHWPLTSEPFGEAQPNEDPDSTGTDFEFNLRFPGQYYDAESGLHYNYYRDYEPGIGRYIESDPIGLDGGLNKYQYAAANAMKYGDWFGLKAEICCRLLDSFLGETKIFGIPFGYHARHCYVRMNGGRTFSLYPSNGAGWKETNYGPDYNDQSARCKKCKPKEECDDLGECFENAHTSYPAGSYWGIVKNSNTYAGTLARECCKDGIPDGLGFSPGINSSPPKPYMPSRPMPPNILYPRSR